MRSRAHNLDDATHSEVSADAPASPRPGHDLTYNDVFMVPQPSAVPSRLDVDLSTPDGIGTTIPVVVANMTAVAGKRMAETVARRGGLAVLPAGHPARRRPRGHRLGQGPRTSCTRRRSRWPRRHHRRRPRADPQARARRGRRRRRRAPGRRVHRERRAGVDRFTQLDAVMSRELLTLADGVTPAQAFDSCTPEPPSVARWSTATGGSSACSRARARCARRCTGRRSTPTEPADGRGRDRDQRRPRDQGQGAARRRRRRARGRHRPRSPGAHARGGRGGPGARPARAAVAGNVVTAEGVRDLDRGRRRHRQGRRRPRRHVHDADDDRRRAPAVLGGGSAPTRPRRLGKHVWADGGVRYPRDVALALAGGAANVMFGIVARRHVRVGRRHAARRRRPALQGELRHGVQPRRQAPHARTTSAFDRARKELFEEGISLADVPRPGAPRRGGRPRPDRRRVRSACTYAGARTLEEFHERAVVGVQSAAGYDEGLQPLVGGPPGDRHRRRAPCS